MKTKNIILFITLLVLLVGAVSASEVSNDTADITYTDTIAQDTPTDVQESVTVKSNENKEILKEDGNTESKTYDVSDFSSLKSALTSNGYDTVTVNIESNINLNSNTRLNEAIRTLTINGNGKTINGTGTRQFLLINLNQTVTINNLNIFNCSSTNEGGAIYNNGGTITINNSTLNNNQAVGYLYNNERYIPGKGGAIYNNGGTITINNTSLNNNQAPVIQYGGGYGGAIYNDGGTITINNSTLNNNQVYIRSWEKGSGGAIYNNGGTITINNTNLDNNTAIGDHSYSYLCGGAIYNDGILTLSNSTLNNSIVKTHDGGGGAIYNNNTLTITNSTLNNNSATGHGGTYNGGAIYNDGILTLSNSTLNNNNGFRGGAICNNGNVSLRGSNLTQNTVSTEGGAICNYGNLNLTDSHITQNNASNGGAIYNNGNLNLTDSHLTQNNASNGGAIHNRNTLTITNTTLKNNTGIRGGVIYNYGNLNLTDSHLTQNNATKIGGAIYNYGNLNLTDSHITQNNASDGGAIYNNNTLTINNSTLNSNIAISGGAIYNNKTLTINNTNLTNNTVDETAGAIYNTFNLTIMNSTLNKNTAQLFGGAIVNAAELTIPNCLLMNCTLNNNKAIGDYSFAGAISNWGNLTINNNTLNNNTAYSGGSISNNGNLTITDSKLNNNRAVDFGGAIYFVEGIGVIEDCHFENNSATNGGAIYSGGAIELEGSALIEDNYFENNSATNGASIYNRLGNFIIKHNTFEINIAKNKTETAIENTGSNVIIKDNTNYDITPFKNTIYNEGNDTTITKNTFGNKRQTSITIKASNNTPRVNDKVKITVTLKDASNNAVASQNVTLKINNKNYTLTTDSNGKAATTYTVTKNDKIINITATFKSNNIYQGSNKTINLTRTYKADMELLTGSFDTKPGDTVKLIAHIKDNGMDIDGGQLVFKLNGLSLKDEDGKVIKSNIKNGLAVLEYKIPDTLGARTHNLTAVYASSVYGRVELTTPMTINKVYTHIDVNPLYTTNNTIQIKAQIVDQNNQALNKETTVSIKLNGKSYTLKTLNGTIDYTITQTLKNGYYNITIISGENGKYLSSTMKTVLIKTNTSIKTNYINNTLNNNSNAISGDTQTSNIMSILTGSSVVKPGDRLKLIAHISEDKLDVNGGQLVFKLNGLSLKDENGTVIKANIKDGLGILDYKIPDTLGARTHNLTAVYASSKYGKIELSTNLTMNKLNTHIDTEPIYTSSNTTYIKASILDDNNQLINKETSVVIKIDGKSYSLKTSNGTINYQVPTTLSKGLHQITIITGENGKYFSSRANTVVIRT